MFMFLSPAILNAEELEIKTEDAAIYFFTARAEINNGLDSIPLKRALEKKPDEKQHPGNKKPDTKKPDIKKPDTKKPDIKSIPLARPKLKPIVPGKGKIKPVKVPKPKIIKHLRVF